MPRPTEPARLPTGEPAPGGLQVDRRELWLLSYYRVSEIGGAMLFGKVARRVKDDALKILITRHFSDESRHAWLWTDAITRLGGIPLDIPTTYQSRYGQEAGLPTTELELLAVTQVFERRVIHQYKNHQRRKTLHPIVAATLQEIMVDESWHQFWVKQQLKRLEKTLGKEVVKKTSERYFAIDEKVYAEVSKFENEPWRIFGLENP